MSELDKSKSNRGGRRIHESFNEPDLFKDVESVLESARKKGYYVNKSLDIESLIRSFTDVHLEFIDMDGGLSGSLKNEGDLWIMKINSKHHKNRQRFTMAHELGHYIMHKDKNATFEDTTFFRGADHNAMEFAANEFASSVLMPQDDIVELLSKGIRELDELSDEFNVSPSAMKYRLEKLGYTFS